MSSSTSPLDSLYDFIIIGGGTAGLTIATRLSECPHFKILVLEAGADHSTDLNVLAPGLSGVLYDNPKYDWEFKTVPQKELNNRCVPHPRGRTLGGTSTIYQNKITYNSPLAWDAWEKLGNPSWNNTTMTPYLRKFHTYHPPSSALKTAVFDYGNIDKVLEGDSGPIQTAFSDSYGKLDSDFYEIFDQIKRKGGWSEGMGGNASPSSIDPVTRTRSFAVNGYLEMAKGRKNLRVVTEAVVEKIVFEKRESEVTATGVQFSSSSGERTVVQAGKEVILCAGAFHSPAILELSGIGNPDLLKEHGIEVIIDNPNVGENLQDHAMSVVSFESAEGVQTADAIIRDPSLMVSLLEMYQKDHSGPLGQFFTCSAYTPSTLFSPSSDKDLTSILSTCPTSNIPDFENTLIDLFKGPDGATAHYFAAPLQFHVSTSKTISEIRGIGGPPREGNYITLMASQNHPFTKGNVHIISASPTDKPAIDPKYLSHPLDLEILARHVQFFHTLITTPPFSEHFKIGGKRIPEGSFRDGMPTLEEAKGIVRESLMSHFHPVGSCAMLPREKGGVVDCRLKVYGVKGLRICDASVFPMATRGNPISAVYAVAERAADLVKEEWGGA